MNRPHDMQLYSDYAEEHKEELLAAALAAINPDIMGMTRDQALTLAGAMKTCGFMQEDFAEVMRRSSQDKGTFAKQWAKIRGTGKHGEAGAGTIFDYAKQSGWKWPAIDGHAAPMQTQTKNPPRLDLMAKYNDDFKFSVILDSQEYKEKPTKAGEIRAREPVNGAMPEPITMQAFAGAVTSGRTFSPCVYCKEIEGKDENGKNIYRYRAIQQQLFVVDIDNEEQATDADGKRYKKRIEKPLTIEEALTICEKHQVKPFLVYESFSSKFHRNDEKEPYTKFRLCFMLSDPLTVQEVGEKGINKAVLWFISLFGKSADSTTTDTARLIYGTDERDRKKKKKNIIDKAKFTKMLETAAEPEPEPKEMTVEEYLQQSAAADLDGFLKEIQEEPTPAISTGFENLNKIFDGGFYPGLYVLGAMSASGKTSIALQICDNIAASGRDVILFSLEMGRRELLAKSISRLSYTVADDPRHAKSTMLILRKYKNLMTEEQELVKKAARVYGSFAKHIYIHEAAGNLGTPEMREIVKRHIDITGQAPFVVLDYLQIVPAPDPRQTAKQACDANLVELKRLTRDYNLPLLCISSFNRESYKQPVSMSSFKESGGVEYTCDVLLGMQLYGMDYEAGETPASRDTRIRQLIKGVRDPRKIEIKILKNRNGRTGSCVFDFYPAHNTFVEEVEPGFVSVPDTPEVYADFSALKAKNHLN